MYSLHTHECSQRAEILDKYSKVACIKCIAGHKEFFKVNNNFETFWFYNVFDRNVFKSSLMSEKMRSSFSSQGR